MSWFHDAEGASVGRGRQKSSRGAVGRRGDTGDSTHRAGRPPRPRGHRLEYSIARQHREGAGRRAQAISSCYAQWHSPRLSRAEAERPLVTAARPVRPRRGLRGDARRGWRKGASLAARVAARAPLLPPPSSSRGAQRRHVSPPPPRATRCGVGIDAHRRAARGHLRSTRAHWSVRRTVTPTR